MIQGQLQLQLIHTYSIDFPKNGGGEKKLSVSGDSQWHFLLLMRYFKPFRPWPQMRLCIPICSLEFYKGLFDSVSVQGQWHFFLSLYTCSAANSFQVTKV